MLATIQLGFTPGVFGEIAESLGPSAERFGRPDWADAGRLVGRLLETAVMGLWGTVLTVMIGLPLSCLAAKNLAPNRVVYRVSREVLNFCRAMPDALLALIFISAFGLGPWPGVLALGIHSAGFFGKALAESMERVPAGVYDGIAVCGASRWQIVRFAAWPSIEREILGYALYLADRNIRVATTLGIVGAGGIGVDLLASFGTFQYGKAAAAILMVMSLVLAMDMLANAIRRRLE
jgi:phosphonate transport system permease protein